MTRRPISKISRMSVTTSLFMLLMSCGNGNSSSVSAQPHEAPKAIDAQLVPPTTVGMNISPVSPFSIEESFTDPVRSHGGLWLIRNPGGWQMNPPSITLDQTGHPINVPRGTNLMISLYSDPHLPVGSIDCRMSAGWSVAIYGDGAKSGPDTAFKISPLAPKPGKTPNPPKLQLTSTSDQSSLSQLSCKPSNGGDALFFPSFLDNLKPFHVLRFMDWMIANNAPAIDWPERPSPADFTQSKKGVSVEYMVELANEVQADPWFTMPLDATPEYYRQFAVYVRDHLAKNHKVYVELSNEVWNTIFKQARDATARGKSDYPDVQDYMAADYYYADRVRALMAIWSDVFAGQKQRLVRVASAQSAWPDRAEAILSHNETWRSVDMLATAPYFGTNGLEIPTTDQKAKLDGIFANGPAIVDKAIKQAHSAKVTAAKYGLRFGTYEGGQHFLNGVPAIQAQLVELNRDPRMYDLYMLFLTRWQKEIGGLFMAYSSVGAYGQYGAWGHKEYNTQPLSEAPKMRALLNFTAPPQ